MGPERFEYRGRWLAKTARSKMWYENWYEHSTRRTRRRSLGTTDLEKAKGLLIQSASRDVIETADPSAIKMIDVQTLYLAHKLAGKKSGKEARRYFRVLNEFMKPRSRRKAAYRVTEFDLLEQRAFLRHIHENHQWAIKTISSCMTQFKSALNWAAKDQIISVDGKEKVVRVLTHAPTIIIAIEKIAEILDTAEPVKEQWIPTPRELANFLDGIESEPLFRFVIIALNTAARREAAGDLKNTFVDPRTGVLRLNPPGRKQTKKRRATIRVTDNLAGWLELWPEIQPVTWTRTDRSDLYDAFRDTARRIGLPKLTPHVLRHYCATRLRSLGVPRDQTEEWLGHAVPGNHGIYMHMDQDWLVECKTKTDELIIELDGLCNRALNSVDFAESTRTLRAPLGKKYLRLV